MAMAERCPGCGVMGAGCICAIVHPTMYPTMYPPMYPPYQPLPRDDYIQPMIPMPLSRDHAKLMLLVAQQYLDDNPIEPREPE
jgi:hypothetical protein